MTAGLAPHFHARERGKPGLQVLPDPHGDVLEARDFQAVDVVQVFVIEALAQRLAARLDLAQISDESRPGSTRPASTMRATTSVRAARDRGGLRNPGKAVAASNVNSW